MFGHSLAREMEEWHKLHNGNIHSPGWKKFMSAFKAGMDVKSDELLSIHSNSGRFGMSKAGGCTRSAGLKYLGVDGEPLDGSTRVTFFLGHICEVIILSTLELLGYPHSHAQAAVTIDPYMRSYSDGIIDLDGKNTLVSAKSAGYKKSGKERRGGNFQFVRRGFPELPFEGVRKSQPGWWAQLQAEMYGYRLAGADMEQGLVVVMSKDIIKAMADDPYLGPQGNGSLTFYAELIPYDHEFATRELAPTWIAQWEAVQSGKPGRAMWLSNAVNEYRPLKTASTGYNNNRDVTGTFNPCDYCDVVEACKRELAGKPRLFVGTSSPQIVTNPTLAQIKAEEPSLADLLEESVKAAKALPQRVRPPLSRPLIGPRSKVKT